MAEWLWAGVGEFILIVANGFFSRRNVCVRKFGSTNWFCDKDRRLINMINRSRSKTVEKGEKSIDNCRLSIDFFKLSPRLER